MFFYKNPYYDPNKSHHLPNGFENLHPTYLATRDVLKWMYLRYRMKLPAKPKTGYAEFQKEWMQPFELASGNESYITWLGHSSVYIYTSNCALITDPVFSNRASPFSFIGPERKTSNKVDIDQLPRLDIILISHNHYDHLDIESIKILLKKFPDVTIVVPLGLKRWFKKRGARNITELDWWDIKQFSEFDFIKVTAVPSQHWSKRGLFDRNHTLWCGYVIEILGKMIYFAGDTGYHEVLKSIGSEFSIDLGLIPIGAYEPRWFMYEQHISPKEAVMLHELLSIKKSIGIHWGVFELTDESIDEPPRYLKACLKTRDIPENNFITPRIYESVTL